MKKIDKIDAMQYNAGATLRCVVCNNIIVGNQWVQYHHALKHSGKAVIYILELLRALGVL